MPHVRFFAAAREATGCTRADIDGRTVGEVLDAASKQFGADFEAVLSTCRIWVNGEPVERDDAVTATDELAVLPPVSGGCTG